jgi:hypothetical protein
MRTGRSLPADCRPRSGLQTVRNCYRLFNASRKSIPTPRCGTSRAGSCGSHGTPRTLPRNAPRLETVTGGLAAIIATRARNSSTPRSSAMPRCGSNGGSAATRRRANSHMGIRCATKCSLEKNSEAANRGCAVKERSRRNRRDHAGRIANPSPTRSRNQHHRRERTSRVFHRQAPPSVVIHATGGLFNRAANSGRDLVVDRPRRAVSTPT